MSSAPLIAIGLILASAFSAILVYAQELLGKVGTISGLFFGFAFGMGGIGAARCSASWPTRRASKRCSRVCAYLPLIGLLTAFLPTIRKG